MYAGSKAGTVPSTIGGCPGFTVMKLWWFASQKPGTAPTLRLRSGAGGDSPGFAGERAVTPLALFGTSLKFSVIVQELPQCILFF
ncbi:MAG: hypothetical protein BA864_12425 [Desulfuromonadales bacterium C00003093]|nr:MAG: hypothetical protein BA864_12425 [Desulfuromonadales bacterium C00003093]